jgi:RimJ/RimL family protein N-acetyltransferase
MEKIITTEHLILRPPILADRLFMFRMAMPEILAPMGYPPEMRPVVLANTLQHGIARRHMRANPPDAFVIADKRDEFCGVIEVLPSGNPALRTLGYALLPEQQRKGLMTEAVKAVCDDVFQNFKETVAICAYVAAPNVPSRRVLEKAGFAKDAIVRMPVGREQSGIFVGQRYLRYAQPLKGLSASPHF